MNTSLLRAAALLSPPLGATIHLYEHLADLPPFNPDLEEASAEPLPATVADLRARVGAADGLLVSCPEYARGVPGAFKTSWTGWWAAPSSPASPWRSGTLRPGPPRRRPRWS